MLRDFGFSYVNLIKTELYPSIGQIKSDSITKLVEVLRLIFNSGNVCLVESELINLLASFYLISLVFIGDFHSFSCSLTRNCTLRYALLKTGKLRCVNASVITNGTFLTQIPSSTVNGCICIEFARSLYLEQIASFCILAHLETRDVSMAHHAGTNMNQVTSHKKRLGVREILSTTAQLNSVGFELKKLESPEIFGRNAAKSRGCKYQYLYSGFGAEGIHFLTEFWQATLICRKIWSKENLTQG